MSMTITCACPTPPLKPGRSEKWHDCLPVVEKVVLKELQKGLTEAPQGLGVTLNPLHVHEQALSGVPNLQHGARSGTRRPRPSHHLPSSATPRLTQHVLQQRTLSYRG